MSQLGVAIRPPRGGVTGKVQLGIAPFGQGAHQAQRRVVVLRANPHVVVPLLLGEGDLDRGAAVDDIRGELANRSRHGLGPQALDALAGRVHAGPEFGDTAAATAGDDGPMAVQLDDQVRECGQQIVLQHGSSLEPSSRGAGGEESNASPC